MITAELPFPVSVNAMYANGKHGGRFVTSEYASWRDDAGWALVRQRQKPISGPVALEYTIEDKGGNRDLGNLEKGLTDLLVSHKLIDGDHSKVVREIRLRWSKDVTGARICVSPVVG